MLMSNRADVISCTCCGLMQHVPPISRHQRIICARCESKLHTVSRNSNPRTAAIALAALILYPVAVTLPMLQITQFGHATDTSILKGVATLLSGSQWLVGIVVLLCSIIFPVGKLIALLALNTGALNRLAAKHKAFVHRLVEFTGRWGMLDVLLVAVLVAALKLGNMMDVQPGPAAAAFTLCVILSLIASATFNPRQIWEQSR
jgi:paraquat-inducible protein A